MSFDRNRLRDLFATRAILHGDFTLASGKKSTFYINSKLVMFHGESVSVIGQAFHELTKDLDIQGAGGLEVGALPLTAAFAVARYNEKLPLEGFFVRKQAKDHGSKQRVEGVLVPGSRVVIVDDVLTTGGSAQQAVEAVEEAGAKVVGVVCLVDRQAGARELFEPKYVFRSIFTLKDFGLG
jgi:orotate phosphoribosyltransferase